MTKTTSDAQQEYAPGAHPTWPAPIKSTGAIGWMRQNLFSSPLNIVLTITAVWLLWTTVPPVLNWIFLESVWTADNRNDCWAKMSEPEAGACWAFIQRRINLFAYGGPQRLLFH